MNGYYWMSCPSVFRISLSSDHALVFLHARTCHFSWAPMTDYDEQAFALDFWNGYQNIFGSSLCTSINK